jgi:hypothetical protein
VKKTELFRYAGAALALFCITAFAGCPQSSSDEESIDEKLVGNWSNRDAGLYQRTFTIKSNGSFTASINPGGNQGRGMVEGKLVAEGDEYIMTGMVETRGTDWGKAVGGFNGKYITMRFAGTDVSDTFELESDNLAIVTFFGGIYHKEAPGTQFNYSDDWKAGSWINQKTGSAEKSFAIESDGTSFIASLTVIGKKVTVTGKLVPEGADYKMSELACADPIVGLAVGAFNDKVVAVTKNGNNNDEFAFSSADGNLLINQYFGGTYYRQRAGYVPYPLIGSWTNGETGEAEKTFSIGQDGSFTASVDPGTASGMAGRAPVEGRLVVKDNNYLMTKMVEKTGTVWGSLVGGFNGTPITIEFKSADQFELKSTNMAVGGFFGGTYNRQPSQP